MGRDGDDQTIPDTPSAVTASARQVKIPPRYRIAAVIGEGGMGRVCAHDSTLNRDVAIKMLERDLHGRDRTLQVERFVREARAAARLVHPNIVAVHDVDPEAGWLVMALVDGTPLRDEPLPTPLPIARKIAEQVLSALDAAHAAGVIHRDIKPSNIIVGAEHHVTLVDFGIARLHDGELTQTGESLGTPAYMAPEQMRGAPTDGRTDLYALAATLYELVTGERVTAFESPSAETVARLRTACKGDDDLAQLIERCLQAEPAQRFESASQALAVLAGKRYPRAPRKRRRWPLALAVAVIAVAAGIAWFTTRPTARDPRLAQAFELAQRGEHEHAAQILDDYLGEHPSDSDALALRVLTGWWTGADIAELQRRAIDAPLSKPQRAMVRAIGLTIERRESEAAAALAAADRETPNSPEILYMLGEAQWHSQHLDEGVATLEHVFQLDPHWQMALHHVVEYRLIRGETARLSPILEQLRGVDAGAAATLDCRIAIAERDPARAVAVARAGLADAPIVELHICLAQALVLTGDLTAAATAAQRAFELWPIDLREWGGFALHAEQLLYAGKLDEYVALVHGKPSRQRSLALALWRPTPDLAEPDPHDPKIRVPPPYGSAIWILIRSTQQHDESATFASWPELEVRGYAQGLGAELRNELPAAVASYRAALATPAKGDIHMLLSHHLARVLDRQGDHAGAVAACKDVLEPRVYQPYRAVLVPECVLWTGDRARMQELVETWRDATFAHPAVAAIRERLAR